jgi:hypothetical protein
MSREAKETRTASRPACTCRERDYLQSEIEMQRTLVRKLDDSSERLHEQRDALVAALSRRDKALRKLATAADYHRTLIECGGSDSGCDICLAVAEARAALVEGEKD